jgi:hypothetical protein
MSPTKGSSLSPKQSVDDRLKRLREGKCPVHGIGMGQVDSWYYPPNARPYTIAECPRKDCGIRVKAYEAHKNYELLPAWAHLVGGEQITPDVESDTIQ